MFTDHAEASVERANPKHPVAVLFVGVLFALSLVFLEITTVDAQEAAETQKKAYVDVAVATLWVLPGFDQAVDAPAVSNPSDVRRWLEEMSSGQESRLVGDLETQALYGHEVVVLEESGDWAKVAVKGQPTPRNPLGYPGWVPKRQLTDDTSFARHAGKPFAQVEAQTAWMHDTSGLDRPYIELSNATRLPVVKRLPHAVEVATPDDGNKWLRASDVSVHGSEAGIPRPTGQQLVESARKFLGVPYLWAGTSSFGFDCSGFTYTVHRSHGVTIPRDTVSRGELTQPPYGTPVRDYEALQPGDLLYFAYRNGAGAIHHVGMYMGGDKMIHAPSPGSEVSIVDVKQSGWIEGYAGAVRYY